MVIETKTQDLNTGLDQGHEQGLEIIAAATQTDSELVTHATNAADAGHGAFPPFDPTTVPSQVLWLVISFGLLYYLMSRVALPRVAEILEVRRDRIEGGLADARRLEEETNQTIADYEASVEKAQSEAQALAQKQRDKLKADMDKHKAKVDAELQEKLTEAEGRIAKMRENAMANVDTIAADAATAIVSGVLGEPKAADIKKAVKAAMSN